MTRREQLADRLEEIAEGGVQPDVSGEPWADDLREAAAKLRDHGQAIRADLTVAAAVAAELARDNVGAGHPIVASDYGKATAHALEALRFAPPPEPPDDERPEITEEDAATLERVGLVFEQLRHAGDFLTAMRGEFESAQTPVATRWAARIADTLEQMPDYEPRERADDEDYEGGSR